jgi:hypothetical protein
MCQHFPANCLKNGFPGTAARPLQARQLTENPLQDAHFTLSFRPVASDSVQAATVNLRCPLGPVRIQQNGVRPS